MFYTIKKTCQQLQSDVGFPYCIELDFELMVTYFDKKKSGTTVDDFLQFEIP